jgi:hypothetical protein
MSHFFINIILNFWPLILALLFTFYINILIYKIIKLFKFSIEKIIDINNNINNNVKKNNKLCIKLKNKIKLINIKIDNFSQNIFNKKLLKTKYNELKVDITNSYQDDNFNRNNEENSYLNLTETLKINEKTDDKTYDKIYDKTYDIKDNSFELLNKVSSNSILQNTLLELSN